MAKNKKYSESKGEKNFNWYRALKAKKPQWDMLIQLASSWVTCACGNQCDVIPRTENGEPIDVVLTDLGMRFYEAVKNHDSEDALQVMDLIEIRSAFLIRKINS